jgi:hypothetical protein
MREVQVSPNIEPLVLTPAQFCVRNGLTKPAFLKIMRENRGPAVMRPNCNTIIITIEAEQEWRRKMEAEAASEPVQLELARQRRRMSTLGKIASKHPGHPSKLAKAKAKRR